MNPKKREKPIQIKDFSHVFRKHPKESFIGRKQIIDELDRFIKSPTVTSPFLLVLGESGIGKTALLANYICNKQEDYIHYFIKYGSSELIDPHSFIEHLYYALNWKYKIEIDNTNYNISDFIELLKRRIREISEDYLKKDKTQAIFIDAIDESIVDNDYPHSHSIVNVLNSIDFPNNFRVILSSTRRVQKLRLSDPGEEPFIVRMIGNSKENLADIKDYFKNNLLLKDIPQKDVKRLVDKSEGNFQYAFLTVKMVKKKDVDINWLLHNPPSGLYGIYDYKLHRIKETVKESTFKNIWRVMRTIALLKESHSPELISDILEINREEIHDVFRQIEPFLYSSMYNTEPRVCKWYHQSFKEYVTHTDRLSEKERKAIYLAIAKYICKTIENGGIRTLPKEFFHNFTLYLNEIMNEHECIRLLLEGLPREFLLFLQNPDPEFLDSLHALMYRCHDLAWKTKNPKDILFFYLMCRGYGYHGDNKQLRLPIIFDNDREFWDKSLDKLLKSQGPHETAKGFCITAITAALNDKDDISGRAGASPMLSQAFCLIHTYFDNLKDIHKISCFLANEWFPIDEKVADEAQEVTPSPSIKADIKAPHFKEKPSEGFNSNENIYHVYENWKEPSQNLKEKDLNRLIENKEKYDIWIKEPGEYCHRGVPLDKLPRPLLRDLLKTILRSAHKGFVYLKDMYQATRKYPDDLVDENNLKPLRNDLSECQKYYGYCINPKEKPGQWNKEETDPYFKFINDFTYCFIERVKDVKD